MPFAGLWLRATVCVMYSIRHSVTFIGRNLPFSDDRHYKLCSNNFEQNVIISRRHARIMRCEKSNMHSIYDDSMNGVFVNDTKIDGKVSWYLSTAYAI